MTNEILFRHTERIAELEAERDELREKLEAVGEFIESRKTYFPENSLGCVEIYIADGGVDKLDALLKP